MRKILISLGAAVVIVAGSIATTQGLGDLGCKNHTSCDDPRDMSWTEDILGIELSDPLLSMRAGKQVGD